VQVTLFTRLTGDFLIAVAICVVTFAIAHAIQGWDSTIPIGAFAAAFHALVWFSGSLYVAIAVHFLYDLVAGFSYAYLARKMGYSLDTGFETRDSRFVEPGPTDLA
jgi:membrane protease YdiL (CAAX protease family)